MVIDVWMNGCMYVCMYLSSRYVVANLYLAVHVDVFVIRISMYLNI